MAFARAAMALLGVVTVLAALAGPAAAAVGDCDWDDAIATCVPRALAHSPGRDCGDRADPQACLGGRRYRRYLRAGYRGWVALWSEQ